MDNKKKSLTFEVKVGAKELCGFTLYHTYSGIMGKIWVLFSICCLIGAAWTFGDVGIQGTITLIILGLLFTVINPLMLCQKCVKRVKKTPAYQNPFQYILTKDGFRISQGEISEKVRWDQIFQIICTRKAIYLCTDPIHAQIISLEQLGAQAEAVKEFLRTRIPQDIRRKGL